MRVALIHADNNNNFIQIYQFKSNANATQRPES